VAVAVGTLGSARETYAAINRALVAGLRRLGVPAALQPRPARRAPAPSLEPCFHDPAEGEVVVGGRKLVGSAQRREGGVLLQHGSLLLGPGQEEVRELTRQVPDTGAPADEPFVTLAECLPTPPGWDAIARALRAGWTDTLGADLSDVPLSPAEQAAAARRAAHYADLAWTFRC
jgi:lipoyl(octanoyl) transferase